MGDTACRLGGLHDYKGILIGSRTHRQIEIGRHTDSTKRINRIFGTISLGISSSTSIPSSIYTPFIQGTSFGSYTIIFGKVISLIIIRRREYDIELRLIVNCFIRTISTRTTLTSSPEITIKSRGINCSNYCLVNHTDTTRIICGFHRVSQITVRILARNINFRLHSR